MRFRAEEVEAAALQLAVEERAELAARLIASLEEQTAVERTWITEAERREALYRAEDLKTTPASSVIARMRAQLG